MDKQFEKEVIERLIRIETKMGDNDRRISEIEDKIKWLERTVIGALITGRNWYYLRNFKVRNKDIRS